VEVDQASVESVARSFLLESGLIVDDGSSHTPTRSMGARSLITVLREDRRELLRRTLEHLGLTGASLALAALLAIPLGMGLAGQPAWSERAIRVVGLLQTIPSIALLAFMIPLFGVGASPAIAALFLYGLFPIVRNTVTGIQGVDPAVTESAAALGMTPRQLLFQVQLPLATPVILAGVRTAAVINVGTATLAAFIGAGGLGQPIVSGLQLNDSAIILSGALPAAVLAWVVDGGLAVVERAVRPQGISG
jgi:osmoprotectant transport system permease protein